MQPDKNDLEQITHPGTVLLNRFMRPEKISINKLARDLDVPPNRIHAIIHGKRSITADTAMRLAVYFDVAAESWLGLQLDYDLRVAERQYGTTIIREVRRRKKLPVLPDKS